MAKPLSTDQIAALTQAAKNTTRLTRLQVFILASAGLIEISGVRDSDFSLTGKGQRALKRHARQAALDASVPVVREAALEILDTADRLCNHRAIWNRVGRDKFERDEVLNALRALRDEGVLETVKLSGNNFQIMWRRGPGAPAVAAPEFVEVTEV